MAGDAKATLRDTIEDSVARLELSAKVLRERSHHIVGEMLGKEPVPIEGTGDRPAAAGWLVGLSVCLRDITACLETVNVDLMRLEKELLSQKPLSNQPERLR